MRYALLRKRSIVKTFTFLQQNLKGTRKSTKIALGNVIFVRYNISYKKYNFYSKTEIFDLIPFRFL